MWVREREGEGGRRIGSEREAKNRGEKRWRSGLGTSGKWKRSRAWAMGVEREDEWEGEKVGKRSNVSINENV